MTDSERLTRLINYLKTNATKLALSLGYKQRTVIGYVLNGRNGISVDLAKRIVTKYNIINYNWLLTGEGDMLNSDLENSIPPPDVGTIGFESVKIFAHLEQRITELKEENKWLKRQIELKDEQIKHFLARGGEVIQPDQKNTSEKG